MALSYQQAVPLSARTTLEVGGAARWWAGCHGEAEVVEAVRWARDRGVQTLVLGGGSNVLVSDDGFDGLVIRVEDRGFDWRQLPGRAEVRVGAGVAWDDLVALAVEHGLGGLEGLSGIPGWCGAAPIQNIGAYGQEVAETLVAVRTVDRATGEVVTHTAKDCGFGYRSSHFKGMWRDRYVVTRVDLSLPRTAVGTVRYGELAKRFESSGGNGPSLAEVRAAVLELRRGKSMVLDPADENRRSAGSFFLNPVMSEAEASRVEQRARALGATRPLPRFPAPGGVKLPAAWLIEEAGFERGHGAGAAGLSSRHCLALVNRGGATAADMLALAREVRRGVREKLGVVLEPEPVFVGFGAGAGELLD